MWMLKERPPTTEDNQENSSIQATRSSQLRKIFTISVSFEKEN